MFSPPPETGKNFTCKSVMYYYNEQECILNAESRHSKPDLFIPEEDDFTVDYFDINCRLEAEKCPVGHALHTIKTLNAALPEGDASLHVIETFGNSVAECMTKYAYFFLLNLNHKSFLDASRRLPKNVARSTTIRRATFATCCIWTGRARFVQASSKASIFTTCTASRDHCRQKAA